MPEASARKRCCQACSADWCSAHSAWRVMLSFLSKLPTPLPRRLFDVAPLWAWQIEQMPKPFLHPRQVSFFCETGLRHENSALHCHLFSRNGKGHTWQHALGNRGSRRALPTLRMHLPQTFPAGQCPSESSFGRLMQPRFPSPTSWASPPASPNSETPRSPSRPLQKPSRPLQKPRLMQPGIPSPTLRLTPRSAQSPPPKSNQLMPPPRSPLPRGMEMSEVMRRKPLANPLTTCSQVDSALADSALAESAPLAASAKNRAAK